MLSQGWERQDLGISPLGVWWWLLGRAPEPQWGTGEGSQISWEFPALGRILLLREKQFPLQGKLHLQIFCIQRFLAGAASSGLGCSGNGIPGMKGELLRASGAPWQEGFYGRKSGFPLLLTPIYSLTFTLLTPPQKFAVCSQIPTALAELHVHPLAFLSWEKKPFHLPHEIMKGTWCSFSSSCSGFVASQSLMGSDRALVGKSGSGRADTLQLLHFKAFLLRALTAPDFKLQVWSHPE